MCEIFTHLTIYYFCKTRNHAWNDEGVRHYCELYASSSVRQSRVIYVTDFTVGIFEQLTVT